MALDVIDGLGAAKTLKTTLVGSDLVPHHVVEGTVSVTGTFWQATQPVSLASLPALAAGTNGIGKLTANSGVTIGAVELAAGQTLATLTNLGQMAGQAIAMGTGVRSAGTQRVTIATDDSVPVTGTFWQATQPVSLASLPALAAGTNAIGKLAANSGVDIGDVDVTSLPTLPSGTNTIGFVGDAATTTGGTTGYSVISTAAVLAAEVKAAPGTVYSIQAFNTNAAARYVRLYNQTGAPGSGDAANIVWRGMVPGNTAVGGFNIPLGGSKGIACATGIGIRASAAIADNDTTVLAANELIFNVQYK